MMRERQARLDSQGQNSTLEGDLGPKSLLVDTLPSCFRLKKDCFGYMSKGVSSKYTLPFALTSWVR